jgi:hypothetical protein
MAFLLVTGVREAGLAASYLAWQQLAAARRSHFAPKAASGKPASGVVAQMDDPGHVKRGNDSPTPRDRRAGGGCAVHWRR